MTRAWIFVLMIAAGGCSTPAPAKPSTNDWQLYDRWSGGKPPGTTTTTTLASDGRFSSQRDQEPKCEVVLPQDLVRPITAALAAATLTPGGSERVEGSVNIQSILMLGEARYSLPARDAAPALHAAIDAAQGEGATRCLAAGPR